MNRDVWYNWWASRDQIAIPGTTCPSSPDGMIQSADAVIATGDWQQAYLVAAFVTLAITVVVALLTYETRVMGDAFKGRWFKGMLVAALLVGLACFVWLAFGASVTTSGCQYGEVATRIPVGSALNRTIVAVIQSGLLFFLVSWLVTRLARVVGRPGWVNNAHFPVR